METTQKIKSLKMHILKNIKIFGTMETLFKDQKWRFYNLWKVRCYIEPGGVRIGTAEIYRQVEKINFIRESLVCRQRRW